MTEVAFHFNIPERIPYVCRLLRKALARVEHVVVVAEAAQLEQLNQQLWQLSATDFLGHARLGQSDALSTQTARIWLTEQVADCARHQVLVSLLAQVPTGFESFERVIEIVGLEESDRALARERWRHYTQRGYKIVRHDVQVKG